MGAPSRNSYSRIVAATTCDWIRRATIAILLVLACAQISPSARASDLYEYDAAGRLFRVTHHTGRITTYTFDDNSNVLSITTSLSPTGVEGEGTAPLAFSLGRAHPNPGQSTQFTFSLPHAAPVTVRLFDVSGKLVAKVVDAEFGPGLHEVDLPLEGWAAGVYFYRLDTPGFSKIQKLVHLK